LLVYFLKNGNWTLKHEKCRKIKKWENTSANLFDVGRDLGAGVGDGPGACPTDGGAVGDLGHLPGQAAVNIAHLPFTTYHRHLYKNCIYHDK
jgi:hypothetical protein